MLIRMPPLLMVASMRRCLQLFRSLWRMAPRRARIWFHNRTGEETMKGRRFGVFALVAVALVLLTASGGGAAPAEVWFAEISPLTGPLSFVGVDNRQGVDAAVREINARGGIKGRRVRVQLFDDGSNPSQAVSHMNKVADDDKFLGVIGSGFSSSGLAVAPIVEREKIPYISMASSVAQVSPPKPYYYMTTATSRLFAYSLAFQLRKRGIKRIALMADNASVTYLQPACPQNANALINSYLGPVARYLPRRNPSRAIALRVDRLLRKQGSTFNYDGYTAIRMFRAAILKSGFSRSAINSTLENRMRGFVGPGGRYYYSSRNHSGLGLKSMVVSKVARCKMVPIENLKKRY